MAGDVQVKLEPPNPCCVSWKNRYSKLEEKRNALRQAVKLLEQQIDKIQAEAKKVCEEERARADFEKQRNEKESAARLALENEIAALKSEILSIEKKQASNNPDSNSEAKALQDRVAEGEREIKCLKEAVQNERRRVDSEKKKAEAEKKKAAEELKGVDISKFEKEIAEKYRLQMEVLRKEADQVRSKLAAETVKLTEANKKLEVEKKRTVKETKRADFEKAKAEEQRKSAEACKKLVVEGKVYAESLSRQLEENKRRIDEAHDSKLVSELSLKIEEANKKLQLEKQKACSEKERADAEMSKAESQRKIAEMNRKRAMEEKSRAEKLCRLLEEDKLKISELEKQTKELLSTRAAGSVACKEIKLLKKQLKLEKMKKKHSKQVAGLERSRNSIFQQEIARLKLEFDRFSCCLDLLHKSLSPRSGARDALGKNVNIKNMARSALNPSFTAIDTSGSLRGSVHHLSPLPGENFERITGTNSKSESLLGGSTRTMLKSPAINSSTTSFSNGQLVAQDKGAFSVTTSAKSKLIEEYAQPTVSQLSDEVNEMRSGENLAVVAENIVRGPVSEVEVGKVSSKKRKRILDTVETIENLYIQDKTLHVQIEEKLALLHGIVERQSDRGIGKGIPPFLGSSDTKHGKHNKKRKSSFQLVMQHARDSSERNKIDDVGVHGDTRLCEETSPTGVHLTIKEANREGTCDFDTMAGFEELANGDYMNLLNLDDAGLEECYRAAMVMPLSPILPEIDIQCAGTQDVDIALPLLKETLCEEFSFKEDKVLSSQEFDIDMVISSKPKSDGAATSISSLVHMVQKPVDTLGVLEDLTIHRGKASVCLNHSVVEMKTSNATVSGDEKSRFMFEREFGHLSNNIPEHSIVFSSLTDRSSISKVYYMIKTCIDQLSLATRTGWMVREILLAIKMEDKLLAKEKVCALFSLLMVNFSVVALSKFGDSLSWALIPCLDSFAGHVQSVMSDVEIRNLFVQIGCLDELFNIIENFLVDEGVRVLRDVSFGSSVECDSRDRIQIDGSTTSLSFIPASAEQLVAGSVILASISVAFDQIGFICETSYNILRADRLSNSLKLTILHIFAFLGGDKFFSLSGYSLMMTVLKSIVRNMEGPSLSGASICCIPLVKDAQTAFGPSLKCPFVEDNGNSLSVNTVASLLLEKIKAYYELEKINQHAVEPVYCAKKMNSGGTACLNKYDISGNLLDVFTTTEALSSLTDLLALVELVACNMGWLWTSDKIVPELLKLLESSVYKRSTSGVVILLGQLGRFGVQAFGYEDKRVERIRSDLASFIRRGITVEAGLPIQIATVTALLGLLSFDFETILQTNEKLPAVVSYAESTELIRKWFYSLNKKQQDLALSVLHSGGVSKK